ncbi:MAG: 2OG-Fe(II) oxygenase [Cyclobacteriaceae bacterium]|nr:MAG: 2OG-Fe(II) oxygenase [Cyclobacteriaceae bacterium]
MVKQFEDIAAGLADEGFAVANDFLQAEEVKAILSLPVFKEMEGLRRAGVSKQGSVHADIRGDYIQWIDPRSAESATQVYLTRLHQLVQHLRQALFISIQDAELHYTVYPPGTFYKRHLDRFKDDDHRRLSVICYLNQNWKAEDGGQLKIYLPNGNEVVVLPEAGRLVCFRSELLEHEVLPATRPRRSITGWLLDCPADLKHLGPIL